jgi:hypothetical protein
MPSRCVAQPVRSSSSSCRLLLLLLLLWLREELGCFPNPKKPAIPRNPSASPICDFLRTL